VITAVAETANATQELIGGRYRLGAVIGQGGLSTVHRAHDESLGRDVAIKWLNVGPVDSAREDAELAILTGLDHHNLITLLDAGTHPDVTGRDRRFIVMPLVRGMNLQERLHGSRIAARNIGEIGYDIAEALEYVHAQGVVHRDVKPSNILLVDYGNNAARARAKLTDFGIAVAPGVERFTEAGTTTGTAAYLSPEQAAGETVGLATDTYAAGLVLLQCFTRTVEFPGTVVESAVARLSRQPRIPEYLPNHWRGLLSSMTARDPRDRPSDRELVSALRQVVIAESGRHKEYEAFFATDNDADGLLTPIPDEALHRESAMAARLFESPIAMVSLYDGRGTRVVSHYGDAVEQIVRAVDLSGSQAPRSEAYVVEDALAHPELADSPLVKPPIGLRFYAGAPLTGSDGRTVGTLSVADVVPHSVSEDQLRNLHDLAALVVAQLELRTGGLRTGGLGTGGLRTGGTATGAERAANPSTLNPGSATGDGNPRVA
jgi:serine/threonine protein kinase